jgi:hypothetical protein
VTGCVLQIRPSSPPNSNKWRVNEARCCLVILPYFLPSRFFDRSTCFFIQHHLKIYALYEMLCEICKAILASAIFYDPSKFTIDVPFRFNTITFSHHPNLRSFQQAKDTKCYICYALFKQGPYLWEDITEQTHVVTHCSYSAEFTGRGFNFTRWGMGEAAS